MNFYSRKTKRIISTVIIIILIISMIIPYAISIFS